MTKPNYAIMHVRRVKTIAGLVRLDAHCRRQIDGKAKWQSHPEQEQNNKYWSGTAYQRRKQLMDELQFVRKPQRNAATALEWVFTSSVRTDRQKEYLEVAKEWIIDQGHQILGIYEHWDETVPHVHILTLPVVQEQDGLWRYSADRILGGRKNLEALQDKYWAHLQRHQLDRVYNRGIRRPPRERPRHTELADYQRRQAQTQDRSRDRGGLGY